MKRKASQTKVGSSSSSDPRDFSWYKFNRNELPSPGDRIWLKAEQCYGSILAIPSQQEGEEDKDAVKSSTKDHAEDGPCQEENGVKKQGNQQGGCIDEEAPCRMVRLDNSGSTPVALRRPQDAVLIYNLPAIVICYSTEDFRILAQTQDISPGVVEIGCSTGQTSRLLWKRCDQWIGWDTGKTMVDKLNQEISSTHQGKAFLCTKLDPIVDPESAWKMVKDHFGRCSTVTVLIDIGGNREAKAVGKILKWALELPLHCEQQQVQMIVIKSEEMFELEDPLSWFLALLDDSSVAMKTFPTHPLKAPKRCSPQDSTLPVCRYYNYHPDGCKKGSNCELDHTHCHWCLKAGHVALECPEYK